jgi:hypothetical protein
MNQLPFPSNENWQSHSTVNGSDSKPQDSKPWQRLNAGESMPMMFQLAFGDGQQSWFAYSDLREVRMRDKGFIQLFIFGIEKYTISIEGRHLSELATLLGMGRIKSIEESPRRSVCGPEKLPAIDKINVEVTPFPGVM